MSNRNKDAEYDFRGKKGVRGKYYEAMQKGFTAIVRKADGSTVITETKMIALAPDVQEYFPIPNPSIMLCAV